MRKYRSFAGDVASDFYRLKSEAPAALRIGHLHQFSRRPA
jgi:hypothetical protein